jgi:hypothetical protein
MERKMKKIILFVLAMVFLLVTVVVFAQSVQKVVLPGDAQRLSELVPSMGEHWANPENMPIGPIYLVHDGEVIGIEYMFTVGLMKEAHINTPEGEIVFKHLPDLPVDGWVDHVEIEYMSHGHEGFDVPHFDVHLYFITPEERQKKLVPHTH